MCKSTTYILAEKVHHLATATQHRHPSGNQRMAAASCLWCCLWCCCLQSSTGTLCRSHSHDLCALLVCTTAAYCAGSSRPVVPDATLAGCVADLAEGNYKVGTSCNIVCTNPVYAPTWATMVCEGSNRWSHMLSTECKGAAKTIQPYIGIIVCAAATALNAPAGRAMYALQAGSCTCAQSEQYFTCIRLCMRRSGNARPDVTLHCRVACLWTQL